MKTISLILTLVLLLPSAQLMACGMGVEQENVHAGMNAQEHMNMSHHGASADADAANIEQNCCDSTSGSAHDNCQHISYCSTALPNGLVIATLGMDLASWKTHYPADRYSRDLPLSHSLPPYRPPSV